MQHYLAEEERLYERALAAVKRVDPNAAQLLASPLRGYLLLEQSSLTSAEQVFVYGDAEKSYRYDDVRKSLRDIWGNEEKLRQHDRAWKTSGTGFAEYEDLAADGSVYGVLDGEMEANYEDSEWGDESWWSLDEENVYWEDDGAWNYGEEATAWDSADDSIPALCDAAHTELDQQSQMVAAVQKAASAASS
eukprot:10598460-Lingulodinium_polyedra.AAC.1